MGGWMGLNIRPSLESGGFFLGSENVTKFVVGMPAQLCQYAESH